MKQQLVIITCDVCGETSKHDGIQVQFGPKKALLDLCEAHNTELHECVGRFVSNAASSRATTAAKSTTSARKNDPQFLAAVRLWAKAAGKEVRDRGRVPQAILDEYKAQLVDA